MEIYNHFEYARRIARKLKDVEHTDKRPRFFEAHGIETYIVLMRSCHPSADLS